MSEDISGFKCFFMKHSMTVIAAAVLSALIGYGILVPDATIAEEKIGILLIGGVLYALGWIRGNLDGLCQAAESERRKKKTWK